MIKEKIILVGAGGHSKSCIDIIELENKYQIVGLIGMDCEVGLKISGYEVIGTDKELIKIINEVKNAANVVGQIKDNNIRPNIYNNLKKLGFKLPKIISPRAYVSSNAYIGAGTFIMHDVLVNSGAKVGNNCIINSKALIEHDVEVDDHCHISTNAILNGGVKVGKKTFIGSGFTSKQYIKISKNCLIGAGITLKKDLLENEIIK